MANFYRIGWLKNVINTNFGIGDEIKITAVCGHLRLIRATGGIVPDQHWEENWALAKNAARIAQSMGLTCVMSHAGFLPHDASDPSFEKLIGRLIQIAGMFADHGLTLSMETGQESATRGCFAFSASDGGKALSARCAYPPRGPQLEGVGLAADM